MRENIIKKQEQGKCPVCGTDNLEYGSADFEDNVIMYPVTCLECSARFDECYSMNFIEHENIVEHEVE